MMSKIPWQIGNKIEQKDILKKMSSGIFWSLLGNLFSKGALLLATILTARILGQEAYGEVGFMRSSLNMFASLGSLGLGITATKYIAGLRFDGIKKVGEVIGFSKLLTFLFAVCFSLLIFIFSAEIATKIMSAPHLIREVEIAALIVFFLTCNTFFMGIMQGFHAFKNIAGINLISGIISLVFQVIFAYLFGVKGAIIGLGLGHASTFILYTFYSRKKLLLNNLKYNYSNLKNNFPIFLKFSLPSALAALLVTPAYWLCNILLIKQGGGYSEMAIFDATNTWRMAVLFVPAAISQIILPLLIEKQDNTSVYKKIIKYNIYINGSISFLIAVVISIFSKIIMSGYGIEFEKGSSVLCLLCFSNILIAINDVIGQVIASKNKMWTGFMFNLLWAIIVITLSYSLIPPYGAWGLSLAIFFSYLAHTIIQSIFLRLVIKKTIFK